MLSVEILNSNGMQRTFTGQFVEFSWVTRNNEGVDFTASMPGVNASIVLCVVDDFTKAIDAFSKVVVTAPNSDFSLELSVVNATNLDMKSRCEISCSGDFFTETNNVWGSLTIPADEWANTQTYYGLDMVTMYEDNFSIVVNANKKEDIVLGINWGFNVRHNISVAPFSTGDGTFDSSGVGIFKNAKEDENDPIAPIYRLEPEQIIDYEIEAAQPPVTHLRTAVLGEPGPVSQVPPVDVLNYSGTETIWDRMHGYSIEELDIAAFWVRTDNTEGEMISQSLIWSDGVSFTWSVADVPAKRLIIGIFPDAWAEAIDSNTVHIIDRNDGVTVKAVLAVPDATSLIPITDAAANFVYRIIKTTYLGRTSRFPEQEDYYVLWFRRFVGLTTKYFGIGYTGTSYSVLPVPLATAFGAQHGFTGSCKTLPGETEVGYNSAFASALYVEGSNGRMMISVTKEGNPSIYGQWLPTVSDDFEGSTGAVWFHYRDFIATEHICSESAPAYTIMHGSWYLGPPTFDEFEAISIERIGESSTKMYREEFPSSTGGWTAADAQWIIDKDVIAPDYDDLLLLMLEADNWRLIKPTGLNTRDLYQAGSISQWRENIEAYIFGRRIFLFAESLGSNTWRIYLQISAVPFLTRSIGAAQINKRIAEGVVNTVDLPFKVGAISQSDADRWDKDLGRIKINIERFYVRNNTTGVWVEKSVQDLGIIALSSYIKVRLNLTQVSYTTIKVTGFSLRYSGGVKASVSGIITE